MRWSRILVAATVVAVAAVTAGCGSSSSSRSSGCTPVSIGFMGPLTGGDGALGRYNRNASEIAVAAYNADHADCPVGLVSFDSQGNGEYAVNLADQIVADPEIVALVGPTFSGETLATMPTFEAAGLPVITASATNPTLSEQGWKYFHRIVGNDATQAPAGVTYLTQALGVKKVAVIDDTSVFGKTLADLAAKSFADEGVEVAIRSSIDPDSVDYRNTVTALQGSGIDAIYFGGVTTPGGRLVRQTRDAGITAPFIGGDGLYGGDFFDNSGGAAVGAFVTCACLNAAQPKGARQEAFVAAYKERFGADPTYFATEYFDATNLVLEAIRTGHTTRAEIQAWLADVDYKGVTKEIRFDRRGEIQGSPVFVFRIGPDGSYNQVGSVVDGKLSQG